jgi:ferredoxin-NADP reductase
MAELKSPPNYRSELVSRREVAERTLAFQFRRPPGFDFTAGQFMEVSLDPSDGKGPRGNTHAFSIASAPQEDALMVTTRMRDSDFKHRLASMPLGTEVTLAPAAGELLLDEDPLRPAVLLAGGIGITPFRSIVLDATRRRLGHEIGLFYSNRRPEDAPFLEELREVSRENPRFQFVPTMTGMEQSHLPWEGERGRIDRAMLARHSRGSQPPVHYIAGPQKVVDELHAMLTRAGIPEDRVRAETFDGY